MKKNVKKVTVKATAAAVITSSVLSGAPTAVLMAADTDANGQESESNASGKATNLEDAKKNLQSAKENKASAEEKKADAQKAADEAQKASDQAQKEYEDAQKEAEQALAEANKALENAKADSVSNKDASQTDYENAMAAKKAAEENLNAKKAAYDKAMAAKKAADEVLAGAQETVKVTEQEVAKNKEALEAAQKDLEAKNAAVDEAQAAYDEAVNALDSSNARIQELKNLLDNAEAEKTAAENKVKDAQAEYESLKKQYDDAVAEKESSSSEYAAAKEKAEAAENDYNQAVSKQQEYETALSQAQAELEAAQNAQADAENGLTEAEKDAQIAEAEQKVANLQSEYDAAQADVAEKKSDYDQKQAEYEKAQAEYEVVDAEGTEIQQRIYEKAAAVDDAENAYNDLLEELENAQSEIDDLNNQKSDLEQAIKDAETKKEEAVAAQKQAEETVAAKEQAVKDAEAEYEKAKALAEDAQTQFNKGSFGFFESRGSTLALSYLTDGNRSNYTVQGDENDATSLENMKRSLAYIKECNELRAKHGLDPLLVADELMAIAQYDANASAHTMDHVREYGVAENLAWRSKDSGDPFDGWYYEEKEKYDNGTTDFSQVGHYLNIVDDGYLSTGYAISLHQGNNVYKRTDSQVFDNFDGVSIEEYEKEFLAYYNGLKEKINAAEKLKADIETTKKDLEDAKAAYAQASEDVTAADSAYDEKVADLDALNEKIDAANEKLSETQKKADAAKEVLDEKRAELQAVKDEQEISNDKINDAAYKRNVARDNAYFAERDYNDAVDTAKEKEDALNAGKEEFKSVTGKDITEEEIAGAADHVKQAEKALADAKAAKADADQRVTDATAAVGNAQDAVDTNAKDVSEKKERYDQAEAERKALLEQVDAELKDLAEKTDAAKTVYNDAVDAQNKADQNYKTANQNYQNEVTNQKDLTAEKEEKAQALEDAKTAKAESEKQVSAAKDTYDTSVEEYAKLQDAIDSQKQAEEDLKQAETEYNTAELTYENAKSDLDEKEKALEESKNAVDALKDLTIEDVIEHPVTLEGYTSLNDQADAVKAARQKVADAEAALKEKKAALDDANSAYQKASEAYDQAVVALTVAQTEYDEMLSEAGKSLKATFDWDGAKDKDGKITAETVKVTNISSKYGDVFADTTAAITKTSETKPTCTADGSIVYTATAVIKDADGTEIGTVTDTYTETVKATGHAYGEPAWNWTGKDGDYKATATFTCANDPSHVETVQATVKKSQVAAPTCEKDGYELYTATVTFEGKEYTTEQKDVKDAIGHDYGEPVWSDWKEVNGKWTATATFTCKHDSSHVATPEVTVSAESKDATCTTAGTVTYTASVELNGKTYTDPTKKVVSGKALGHTYSKPVWSWNEDHTKATATFTCDRCKEVTTVSSTKIDVEEEKATCTTDGKKTYTTTLTFEGKEYSDTDTETVKATGHAYGEPTWNWEKGKDGSYTVTATSICANDKSHKVTETATVKETVKEATCTEAGSKTSTATVTIDGKTYTDTKTEVIPATGHEESAPVWNWAETEDGSYKATATFTCKHCGKESLVSASVAKTSATEPTCTEDGKTVYTATVERDGKTYTDTKTVTAKKLGHKFGEPVWSDWKEVNGKWTCTATFTCQRDKSHVETPEIVVTADSKDATCTTAGTVTYTASVELDGKVYKNPTTKVVSGTVLGHAYGEPEWKWNEDHTEATATFTCNRCKESETVKATVESETTDATCEKDGEILTTATVTFDGKTYTDTKSEKIPATGHAYENLSWTWEKAEDGSYSATLHGTCKHDASHVLDEKAVVKKTGKEATCTEAGEAIYTATVTVDGTEYTDTKAEVLPALGHDDAKQTWNWVQTEDGSYKATVTFICSKCGKETLVSAEVTKVSETAATYEKEGEVVYEAVVTRDGKEYKDTKTIQIAKLVKDSKKDPAASDGTADGTTKKNSPVAGTNTNHQANASVTSSGTPKTGDAANVLGYGGSGLLAAMTAIFTSLKKRRK